ncbi:unannotated protein [freshwater metagenome]|uniref:Unannotated protein n=1 Tax=freshwater metagenome TaxID=449393 RepID=A0A6J7FD74_9ZZZZ|nr:WYL domain-containing protein [Actinomycetota bacterium]MSY78318.1 WYL domain-containing protein [Actinomycetota bacterium]MTA62944.1 WYL domain-containing protein [Actinomycetota bacterium]
MSGIAAPDRVQRILAVIPYIIQNPGTPLTELAQRFSLSESDLRNDLELVFYGVGLYPFTPDVLVEVSFDNDCVTVNLADYFHRPVRLTHEQALTLLAGGRALIGRNGSDPDGVLSRAVQKLSAVLGEGAESSVEVALGPADTEILDALQSAVATKSRVTLSYYSYGRDEATLREVDPYRVLSRQGHWYLLAHCHLADAERLFRIDRIQAVELTGQNFDPPELIREVEETLSGAFSAVELMGPESIAWVADAYPYDVFERLPDGTVRLVIPVTATPWLERLLLRLDPSTTAVEVLSGESLLGIRVAAASRILTRYLQV